MHRRCLLLLIVASAAARPLHSTAVSTSWECDAGYYRSAPLSGSFYDADDAALPVLLLLQQTYDASPLPALPTCVRCTETPPCGVGWRIAPCTSTMDASCMPCPSPPSGRVYYSPGRCDLMACAAGYYGALCAPCPKGSYCTGGIASSCGTNCTTPYQGCDSPLQCAQTTKDAYGLTIAYVFTAQSRINVTGATKKSAYTFYNVNSKCPGLLAWTRPYASMQGCAADITTGTQGVVTCVLSVPRCVASFFLQWLLQQSDSVADSIALSACMANKIMVDAPLIQQVPFLVGSDAMATLYPGVETESNALPGSKLPSDAPRLVIERRAWGQSRGQYLLTLLVTGGGLLGLGMGLSAACALAYVRRTRSSIVRSTFNTLFHRRAVATKVQRISATKLPIVATQRAATKPPLVATKPLHVATKPPLIATKPQHVATKPPLVATKPQHVAKKLPIVEQHAKNDGLKKA